MKLKDSKTYINLARSYAGECQARTRYEFIEYGARTQGYKALAELVDKVVYNEFNHARMFYTFIQQSEETQVENIDISAGYPSRRSGTLSRICASRRKTSWMRQSASIPSSPPRRGRKASRRSQNSMKTSSASKPATTSSSNSSTSR